VIIKGETAILSKEKTIDVASIIENEKALQKRVLELESDLMKLNDSVQVAAVRYNKALGTIERLSMVVKNQYDDIIELNEFDLKTEKKKNNFGLYSFVAVGGTKETFTTLDIGINIVRSKAIYSFSIDPVTLDFPIFKVGIGLKLF